MTAQISAYGRLVVDVQSRTTSNGNTMSFTRMAVPLPCQKAENGEATFWLAVTAFGKQADALAKHQKGDMVSVSGNMQITQWTDGHGNVQTGYQVIADSVVSARTVRPGGRKGAAGQPTDALRRAHEQSAQTDGRHAPDFSDDAPF
ncbi:single-stranded DNA-binding protein [Pectobacterium carotovorum]|uniref:Single-stranded DNA-binding protein n=1 Tax=Pectobacterium carotovorum subsp. carotovorum TaxID=555 RepID=A0AAI9PFW8_PECCC|nr:single-stranded DNA-binding protein [Pectobacterium carotovorum]GKX49606.1 single-stranded DNA-binding protein [Pectobacterium carotovorum subsp. carotovorum]GLV71747.1 single-stranded DNA-binding protein [Pectobacterium carotovorum subsp. carotovorum]